MNLQFKSPINKEIVTSYKSVADNLKKDKYFLGTENDTATSTLELKPPVSFEDCKYVFDNSSYVAKCCRIKAQDIIYNDLTLVNEDDIKFDGKVQTIEDNLLENIDELYNFLVDYYYAGLGVIEYVFGKHRFSLKQIPVNTCKIIRVKINNEDYYLLQQKIQNVTNYFKIMGEVYPPNFSHYDNRLLGYCSLLGGDNFYQFFSTPLWVQEKEKIFTEIAISNKNYNTIENGNIATGILNINLEPQPLKPVRYDENNNPIVEPTREEVIANELVDNDSGIAVVFTESNRPIAFDFTRIENDNYSYLESQEEKCEQAVLNCYNIPLARLMINTEKESMNSNKTQSIWEIYTLDLRTQQRPIKLFIQQLIKDLYSIDVSVELGVPIFSDRREIEINNILNQWDKGVLNLKQTITALSEYTNVIDLKDYDFSVNTNLWEFRQIDGYYDLLNEVDKLSLESVENDIDKIR